MKSKLILFATMGMLVSLPAMARANSDTNAAPIAPPSAPGATAASAWPTNPITPNVPGNATVENAGTPAASTNAPVPPPVVSAPVVSAPVVSAPVVTAPVVTAPVVTAPVVSAPVVSAPVVSAPVVSAPVVTAPVVTAPVVSAPAVAAPAVVAAPVASPVPAPPENVNAAPAPVATIPLIEFQDVPLTVAIENLARQAGINYLLDPKIAYGQPDQSGQIKVEPTLSIRWENVTAEQALLALLNNYDLQLISDPQTKIARVTVKDPTAPPPLITRVIQLKYASTSNMLASVEAAFTDRRSHVFPDTRTSQLVVVATEDEQDALDTLVAELDKPTRQVLIEAKLVEVQSSPSTAKGINWSGTLANQNINFGNGLSSASTTTTAPGTPVTSTTQYPSGASTSSTTTPASSASTLISSVSGFATSAPGGFSWNTLTGLTPAIGFLNADGVQAVLSFLNESYDAQTLSTPRLVTLDNEPAMISETLQFPVINITASTTGVNSGGTEVTYSNIGTTLIVTPRITANDYIWLKVIPDVSSYVATVSKVIAGTEYQADEFESRHIETQVMIPNGNTLVMGGLIQDNPTASYTAVPVLGNIPVLGWAFKSESMTMDKENLIIFITPTIVRDSDFQPASSDFLASKPTFMKEPMNPSSFWDKSESDWSNPAPSPGEFGGTTTASSSQ